MGSVEEKERLNHRLHRFHGLGEGLALPIVLVVVVVLVVGRFCGDWYKRTSQRLHSLFKASQAFGKQPTTTRTIGSGVVLIPLLCAGIEIVA
jgi:hypothetical protein